MKTIGGFSIGVLLPLTVALLPMGCGKRATATFQAVPATGNGGPSSEGQASGGGQRKVASDPQAREFIRGKERQLNQGILKQIGLFYQHYLSETGRPPANLEVFKEYIKKEGRREYQVLHEGSFVMVFNVNQTSSTILAYEKDFDHNKNRLVLMGDGNAVRLMSNWEFQALLKAKGG